MISKVSLRCNYHTKWQKYELLALLDSTVGRIGYKSICCTTYTNIQSNSTGSRTILYLVFMKYYVNTKLLQLCGQIWRRQKQLIGVPANRRFCRDTDELPQNDACARTSVWTECMTGESSERGRWRCIKASIGVRDEVKEFDELVGVSALHLAANMECAKS
jgi:hypothetical protein